MIYIRKIFKQDLRDGKQIAFPKEPSLAFFSFDYLNKEDDRKICFIFDSAGKEFPEYNGQKIETRLYAAGSESRIDGELKAFLRDQLKISIDDFLIIKNNPRNNAEYTFFVVTKNDSDIYNNYLLLTNADNHSLILSSENDGEKDKSEGNYNRIIFGAPGTGKSYALNKQAQRFFTSVSNDPFMIIDAEIQGSDKSASVLFAVGFRHASILASENIPSLMQKFKITYDEAYAINQGIRVIDFYKKLKDYSIQEINAEKIKSELGKLETEHFLMQAGSAAIGYKYSEYLYGKSTGDLVDELGLSKTSSQASWIWNGVQAAKCVFENTEDVKTNGFERVTFHPNYSYAQFVGTYKPVQDKDDKKQVIYKYVPGPFLRMYLNARRNPDQKYLLLIEEINRANVAAVFGDAFQLLDRKNGVSEYPITASEDVRNFLADNGINDKELSIPDNMYIWATMNSADQGVFPMDTAFKRRWEFEYIGIDENEDGIKDYDIPLQKKTDGFHEWVKWNDLRHSINDKLTEMKINEDKLLGPYFISEEKLKLVEGKKEDNADEFVKSFKSKVLMYLFEDAVKMRPGDLFDENAVGKLRFSDICKKFDEIGQGIFNFKK